MVELEISPNIFAIYEYNNICNIKQFSLQHVLNKSTGKKLMMKIYQEGDGIEEVEGIIDKGYKGTMVKIENLNLLIPKILIRQL